MTEADARVKLLKKGISGKRTDEIFETCCKDVIDLKCINKELKRLGISAIHEGSSFFRIIKRLLIILLIGFVSLVILPKSDKSTNSDKTVKTSNIVSKKSPKKLYEIALQKAEKYEEKDVIKLLNESCSAGYNESCALLQFMKTLN